VLASTRYPESRSFILIPTPQICQMQSGAPLYQLAKSRYRVGEGGGGLRQRRAPESPLPGKISIQRRPQALAGRGRESRCHPC